MPKVVKGGIIRRQAENQINAVPVESMTFPAIPQLQVPVTGDDAVLIVERVPQNPYQAGDQLFYEDSNHHNDTDFDVMSVVGPAKYRIRVH